MVVVPTATMAEHLRHEQARQGLPVRPRSIRTFAHLLEGWAISKAAPLSLTAYLTSEGMAALALPRFAQTAEFQGLHVMAAQMFEEVPASGIGGDWGRVLKWVDEALTARGLARRAVRIREAKQRISDVQAAEYVFEGFFALGEAEADLILALGRRFPVEIALPDWPSTLRVRARLLDAGFSQRESEPRSVRARQITFAAPSMEREAEEIARRIVEANRKGHPFRHMGVLLRSYEPYGPLLESTLVRFGVPARFYFAESLSAQPVIQFAKLLMQSLLSGWDLEPLLSAVRSPASGIGATPQGDAVDFAWRELLPSRGIPESKVDVLEFIAGLDPLRRERNTAAEWATALRPFLGILRRYQPEDPHLLRSAIAAVQKLEELCASAEVAFFGKPKMPLEDFWRYVESALSLEPLRIPDLRRDVVHVMDVFEARQWNLPVAFICGLTERHFPVYHREDPLLGEAERRRLGLDTATERQQQEQTVFEFVKTTAQEELYLSYPLFDEKGEELQRSFFLDSDADAVINSRSRPLPVTISPTPRASHITDPPLLETIRAKSAKLSASSIEKFIQCPFQYFSYRNLQLKLRPPEPRDRLDVLLQGTIMHKVLAEWVRSPLFHDSLFEEIFTGECLEKRVLSNYRMEAIKLELRRNFEQFVQSPALQLKGWTASTEVDFDTELRSGLWIRGRLDRLEQGPRREALVIDYKYSAADKIKNHVTASDAGAKVQAGLYLAAAEHAFGLKPAAMLFCGLKKEVTWDGWHAGIPGLEGIGTACIPQVLQDLARNAVQAAEDTAAAIKEGIIAPNPADTDACQWCDYRDICRIESASAETKAGGA